MRYRQVIGLDEDGGSLYAAELLLVREGPILQAAGRCEGGAIDKPAMLTDCLRELRRDGQFTIQAAALAMPRAGAAQRLLTLPPLGQAETRLAAAAALEDQISFPAAELCLGWDQSSEGRSIRAVAVRRPLVEASRANLLAAGLHPARVELRPLAAATAFWHGRGDEIGDRAALLVELRAVESGLVFLRRSEVLYSRALPGLGGGEWERLAVLAAELRTALSILRAWPEWDGPEILWLTGPLAAREGLRNDLAELLGLSPEDCRVARPAGLLRLANLPEPGPEMMVPVGLCLAVMGLEALGPDLLAGLERDGGRTGSLLNTVLPLGLAIFLILGGLRLLSGAAARERASALTWLAANGKRLAALGAAQEETADAARRLGVLEKYGGGGRAYLDLLLALEEELPAGTKLTRLTLAGDRVEAMEGTTPSVSVLLGALRAIPVLAGLSLRGQVLVKEENGRPVEAFTLAGPFPRKGARP